MINRIWAQCRPLKWLRGTFTVALGISLFLNDARALSLLDSAQYLFFQPGDDTRVGIEVEFKGLSLESSAQAVVDTLGGKIEQRPVKDYILLDTKPGGVRTWKETTRFDTFVTGTSIGDVLLKIDTNELADGAIQADQAVIELVTEPISEKQANELQRAITGLKNKGARGTDLQTAVSTQVNVELARGDRAKANVDDMLNIARNYYKPGHYQQVSEAMRIPPNRAPYVEPYSPGYMKKLLDPGYKPTWREAYDDFMYRQSLEVLGVPDAWTMPIEKARQRLLAMPDPMVPKVIKLNGIRLSSMFMWMFPDDPLTKVIVESRWAYPRPLIEFRDWNNTFDVVGPTRQALGLKAASSSLGSFDHDAVVAEKLRISPAEVAEKREALKNMSRFDRSHTLEQVAEVARLKSQDDAWARFARINNAPPSRMGKILPESTYVKVTARKLKNARLLYVNREKLRARYGIVIPPEGPTPAQRKTILDAVAWRVPAEFDPPEMYGPEERTLYSTRYGGDGLNGNFGSGRGLEAGEWEGKGYGTTPNVSPAANDYYKKGGGPAYITEGVRETVVAGAAQDLPHGGNDIMFLVDTGDGTRSLIVRESDLRLGQFTTRFYHPGDEHPANGPLHEAEMKRIGDLIAEQKVIDALPIPPAAELLSPREQYIAGVRQLAYRYGEEAAGAYASGFIHGTTSASNQLLQGGIIDYGSTSYHPNHAPLQMLEDSAPSGLLEAKEVVENIAPDGMHPLAPPARPGETSHLPTREELQEVARKGYQDRLRQEFLKMTGLPEHLATQLEKTTEGQRLADSLIRIAEDSGGRMNIKYYTPTQMTRFNTRPLLMELARVSDRPAGELEAVLARHMGGRGGPLSEPGYWKTVAAEYRSLMDLAAKQASKDGVGNKAFFRLVQENSQYARERWQLNHSALERLSEDVLNAYHQARDPAVVQQAIDREKARNRLRHSGFKPYDAVISVTEKEGLDVYRIFDGLQNSEAVVIRAPAGAGESVKLGQKEIAMSTARSTRAQLSVDGKTVVASPATYSKGTLDYRVPLPEGQAFATARISLVDAKGVEVTSIAEATGKGCLSRAILKVGTY